jgi:membrane-bound lytic murein transglycosylase D
MLSSGVDIKSDAEMNDEFDRIVDAVNTLEMDALKQGTGLAPAAEPTPVDVANSATFTIDPTIRAEAEASLKATQSDLPLVMNDYVASFINFFSNSRAGHGTIVASLNRAGRYKDMIQRVLKEEGVPQDLIYQAVAESGFRPQAINPKSGAGGMWQFMPFGVYGLSRTGWYDERLDPEKATHAYAREMKKAYDQLGDWYLAMAAYDWGAGNVQRAVQRTGYADFWELYKRNVLPKETKNYVPIILALTLIAKDAAHYGIQVAPETPVATDVVKPGRAIDLRLVAETIDVDVETLRALNPPLLRLATPDDPSFELHLPAGTAERFSAEIADIPADKWVSWRRHRVEAGETLTSIAKKYHVTPVAIAEANSLEHRAALDPGQKLIIPAAQAQSEAKRRLVSYRVRKGDTLLGIADRFSVEADDVKKWNRLKTNHVGRGMVLRIYTLGGAPEAKSAQARTAAKKKTHPGTPVAQTTTTSPNKN